MTYKKANSCWLKKKVILFASLACVATHAEITPFLQADEGGKLWGAAPIPG